MKTNIHIDSFQSGQDVTRKTKYEDLKRKIIAAGRFSVFEATANNLAAGMFSRLCKDPEVVIENMGYPWTGVKLRAKP